MKKEYVWCFCLISRAEEQCLLVDFSIMNIYACFDLTKVTVGFTYIH